MLKVQNPKTQSSKPFSLVSPKFPEGTIAGVYKRAVAENSNIDAVRFDEQKFNWTLKEFDVNIISYLTFFRDTLQPSLLAS